MRSSVRLIVLLVAVASCIACGSATPGVARATGAAAAARTSAAPTPRPPDFWVEAPIEGDPTPLLAHVPSTGATVDLKAMTVFLHPPATVPGPRRVGIQVGHLDVQDAPEEFPSLRFQFGGSSAGVDEVDVNRAVAQLVAGLLTSAGVIVDLLPATIPPSYLADAFVAIHADSIDSDDASGFKIAHGFYRGPYEDELVRALDTEYARATDMGRNSNISPDMTDYYAFAWYRYEHALAPHTPAAIIEMGYISNEDDRAMLLDHQDIVARGIANGVLRFLAAVPRAKLYADDIAVPTVAAP
jgi:N-acetylmuramoyl-L-alanine amidase